MKKSDPKGNLWQRDTDGCCHIRKVLPQARAIGGFDALITGRKRFQTGARQEMDIIEQDSDGRFKVNPLANWQLDDLKTYIETHNLPRHPQRLHIEKDESPIFSLTSLACGIVASKTVICLSH